MVLELDYAARRPRRRLLWATVLLTLLAIPVYVVWDPSRRYLGLRWSYYQCASSQLGEGSTLYDDDPAAARALVSQGSHSRSEWPVPCAVRRYPEWVELRSRLGGDLSKTDPFVIREMRDPDGTKWLVLVEMGSRSWGSPPFLPGVPPSTTADGGQEFVVTSVLVESLGEPQLRIAREVAAGFLRVYDSRTLKLSAGAAKADDPTRCTIKVTSGSSAMLVRFVLDREGRVHLEGDAGPADGLGVVRQDPSQAERPKRISSETPGKRRREPPD